MTDIARKPTSAIGEVEGLSAALDSIALRTRQAAWSMTGAGDSTTRGVTSAQWCYKLLALLGESSPTVGKFSPWYGSNFVPASLITTQADLDVWLITAGLVHTLGDHASIFGQWGAHEVTLTSPDIDRSFWRALATPSAGKDAISWYVRKADGSPVTSADCQVVENGSPQTTTFTQYGTTSWYRAVAISPLSRAQGYNNSIGLSIKAGKSIIVTCPQAEVAEAATAYQPTLDFDWDRKLTGSKWTFYNAGRGGEYASQLVNEYASHVLGHTSDLDVIYIGLNDYFSGASGATVAGYVATMAAASVAAGRRPIVCTCTPYGLGTQAQKDAIDAGNAIIRADCVEHGWRLADLYLAFDPNHTQAAAALQNADQLHPNEAGNAVIAQTIFDALPGYLFV